MEILNQTAGSSYTNAIAWLQGQSPNTVDYLSQRIHALGLTDTSINALIPLLNQLKHAWGGDDGYETDILDTAFALQALKAASYPDQNTIFAAITYLLTTQNPDGGWSFSQDDDSNAEDSAQVLSALAQYKDTYDLQPPMSSAAAYLRSKQNPDGGFGSGQSTVYETALALIALIESGQGQTQPLLNAVNFLTASQLADGSWNDDPYATALALRALAHVKPDLAITATDIAVSPSTPTVGNSLTATATIHNSGLDTAATITVRLLDNGTLVGDQLIGAIAPGGAAQATFAITALTPAGEHILTVAIDPANTINELSRANNSATLRTWAAAPADLVIEPEYL
ncbi:MAG TPA: CARDB domain-containing protein, partial [Geobacteraceae bacterium]